jgi:hypothetical protein
MKRLNKAPVHTSLIFFLLKGPSQRIIFAQIWHGIEEALVEKCDAKLVSEKKVLVFFDGPFNF